MTDSLKQVDSGERSKGSSLADLVEQSPPPGAIQHFTTSGLIKIAVITVLFAMMNWWQFKNLVPLWRHDPNWSHGFIIPLFSLYLLYARRDDLLTRRRRVCLVGLPLLIGSIFFIFISYFFIRTHWLCELGMVAALLSLVWYLAGPEIIRITWLPILFLIFALPIPDMLYGRIALPLQNLAAKLSTVTLTFLGASITVTASHLSITSLNGNQYGLTVAEACSGVRSLMAYMALGVAWAYLENRPIWQRVILVGSAVPIAIFSNVIRVGITCSMYVFDWPELGKDFMHEFTGLLMLGPALLMFWGLGKLLQSLFVEEEDNQDDISSGQTISAENVNT